MFQSLEINFSRHDQFTGWFRFADGVRSEQFLQESKLMEPIGFRHFRTGRGGQNGGKVHGNNDVRPNETARSP